MYLSEVAGQELPKKRFLKALEKSQLTHAQLIIDKEGYGGLPLALSYALLLAYGQPDLKEKEAQGFSALKLLQHPDIQFVFPVINMPRLGSKTSSKDFTKAWYTFLEEEAYGSYADWFARMEAGNKQGLISVHEMELLHEQIYLKSLNGGNKVCVIWGAEKMNTAAANKFLKVLEEPPTNTFFILISEDESLLLDTIVSRCQIIDLKPLSSSDLKNYLTPLYDENSEALIPLSQGSVRTLHTLLQSEGTSDDLESLLVEGLRTAFRAKGNKTVVIDLMEWVKRLQGLGREEQKSFLLFATAFFRNAFLLNYQLDALVHFQSKNNFDLHKLAPYVNSGNFMPLIDLFEKSYGYLQQNANPGILFTDMALQITRLLNR